MAGLTGPGGAQVGAGGWAVRWRPAPQAPLRLFCLPHTGAGAATYRWWAAYLAPDIEVVAVRLPGRESRFDDPPIDRMTRLVPAMLDALEPMLDRPHAWFGHSMGALIAFEACRGVRDRGLDHPVHLLVSGRRAPHLPDRETPVHAAPTADLVGRLRELNGTPDEVLADRAALDSLLPLLRADFAVSETYRREPAPPLDCPISTFGGTRDPMTTVEELDGWRAHTTRGYRLRIFDGDHFFVHERRQQVLTAIRTDLSAGALSARVRLQSGDQHAPVSTVSSGRPQ